MGEAFMESKAAKNSRFQRGSGVYTCGSCKRQTRSTGRGDNENCGLCVECFEISGIENEIADNVGDPDIPKWQAEIEQLKAACIAKGGKF
jgi:hypothetical protein